MLYVVYWCVISEKCIGKDVEQSGQNSFDILHQNLSRDSEENAKISG
jgi:hypothetical protein